MTTMNTARNIANPSTQPVFLSSGVTIETLRIIEMKAQTIGEWKMNKNYYTREREWMIKITHVHVHVLQWSQVHIESNLHNCTITVIVFIGSS